MMYKYFHSKQKDRTRIKKKKLNHWYDPWIEVTADLSAYSSTGVTMKITGYMGTSFWSDMAIDYTQVYDANIVTGCTDSTASNYDPLAVIDDGSCVYPPVQCCNSSQYGSATASATSTVTVSTCNYLSEYSPIYGVAANTSYTATISGVNANPGWITVYEGSSCGNWVAEGSAPLTWTSTVAGTYYIHWGVDSTCATATGCHTTTLIGNAPVVSGCTDPIATNYDP